jgi:origin recognition complex subunit 1
MPHSSETPPSWVQPNMKALRARSLLSRGVLPREDSDDELGDEDHPWQWVYDGQESPTKDGFGDLAEDDVSAPTARRRGKPRQLTSKPYDERITGARMGSFECRLGDCVLLKAEGEGNRAWVGIICEFGEDENNDMSVNVMCRYSWSKLHAKCLSTIGFSSEQEIRNKHKKRSDFLAVSVKAPTKCGRMLMLLERAIYHAVLGLEPHRIDQRKSSHPVPQNVSYPVSVRKDSSKVERIWKDVYLPPRM